MHLKGFEDFLPKLVEQFCYSKCYKAIFLLADLFENVDLSDNEDDDDVNADDNDCDGKKGHPLILKVTTNDQC